MKIENKLTERNPSDIMSAINSKLEMNECEDIGIQKKNKHIYYKDIAGNRFGKLLVLSPVERISNSKCKIWNCKCDCGNMVEVSSSKLRSCKTTSCGCNRLSNLIGQRFGSVVVIGMVYDKNYSGHASIRKTWECICDCKTISYFSTKNLHARKKFEANSCIKCRVKTGSNHPVWNPNLTENDRKKRRDNELGYEKWSDEVYKRDNYICVITGCRGKINAHHIESWRENKMLRCDISNGVTVLESVHKYFHKLYGRGKNTSAQFEDFKQNLTIKDIKRLIKENKRIKKSKYSASENK